MKLIKTLEWFDAMGAGLIPNDEGMAASRKSPASWRRRFP